MQSRSQAHIQEKQMKHKKEMEREKQEQDDENKTQQVKVNNRKQDELILKEMNDSYIVPDRKERQRATLHVDIGLKQDQDRQGTNVYKTKNNETFFMASGQDLKKHKMT